MSAASTSGSQTTTLHSFFESLTVWPPPWWRNAHRRAVSFQEGEKFAEENGLMFLETSARTGENVNLAFVKTAEKIYDHIKKGIYDPNNDVRAPHGGCGFSERGTRGGLSLAVCLWVWLVQNHGIKVGLTGQPGAQAGGAARAGAAGAGRGCCG